MLIDPDIQMGPVRFSSGQEPFVPGGHPPEFET